MHREICIKSYEDFFEDLLPVVDGVWIISQVPLDEVSHISVSRTAALDKCLSSEVVLSVLCVQSLDGIVHVYPYGKQKIRIGCNCN
jgi:hypothetical protein